MKIPSIFLLLVLSLKAAPRISDLVISDVSDRSFRIIAHSNEPIEPSVLIYGNAALTNLVTSAESLPWGELDNLGINLASASGLALVDAVNLAADTTYYVRLQVRSLADDSVTQSPALQIKTALAVTPFDRSSNLTALANPVLKFHTVSRDGDAPPAVGVLLAEVSGARTPVSTVVQSNTTSFLEMQNLIGASSGTTLPLTEDLPLTLTLYRGDEETQENELFTPEHANISSLVYPKLSPGTLAVPLVLASKNAAQVFLEFPVSESNIYDLEYSDSLTTPSWTPMRKSQLAVSGRLFWMDFPGSGTDTAPGVTPKRFYRIKRIEP